MRLEPLISHTGISMTFYLSIIIDLQTFFHLYILQSWKLKRRHIQLCPYHFLDFYLELGDSGQLSPKIYDKRDDFNFKIINLTNKCSNIPASPAYGVYILQLIRYARASITYSDFRNVIFIWETGYWTRAMQRFALFDLLKSLYSDTKILSKYIPSLQRR